MFILLKKYLYNIDTQCYTFTVLGDANFFLKVHAVF